MKLKLRLDDLRVDTFATRGVDGQARATVRGNEASAPYACATFAATCPGSCEETCGLSCDPTCHYVLPTCAASCPCEEG
jgi:hypothetical protein